MSEGEQHCVSLAPLCCSSSWHEVLSHPDGRDKLFRLLQYTLKLVRGVAAGGAQKLPEHLLPLATLESALASGRQLWRMFKWSGYYSSTSLSSVSPHRISRVARSNILLTISSLRDTFLALYFLLDNIAFLTKMSLLKGDSTLAARRAARAWLVASLLGVSGSVLRLHALRAMRLFVHKNSPSRADGMDSNNGRPKSSPTSPQVRVEVVQLAKFAGDCVVALNLCRESQAHPALVGACGVVSSFIGCWQIWPRHVTRPTISSDI